MTVVAKRLMMSSRTLATTIISALLDTMIKVVQIIKCNCTVYIETSKVFQVTHQYKYQFVGKVVMDM